MDRKERVFNSFDKYPGFPKPGVNFVDIMPTLSDSQLFTDLMTLIGIEIENFEYKDDVPVDAIVGVESRGFILGAAAAARWKLPFIPIRKPGKLPGSVLSQTYTKEYGEDELQIQMGRIAPGTRVVIIDDLLATGGTLDASIKLVKACGGIVAGCLVVIELKGLLAFDIKEHVHSIYSIDP